MKYLILVGKTILYLLIFLLIALSCLLGVLQTRMGKDMFRRIAQDEVNQILNAKLDMGHIDGNFLTGLSVEQLYLHQADDTIAFIPRISFSYRLLPLLMGTVMVEKVELQEPIIHLKQMTDSTWNFQHILPTTTPKDSTENNLSIGIDMRYLEIADGTLKVDMLDTLYSQKIDSIGTKLSLLYTKANKQLDLQSFHLSVPKYHISLKNFTLFAQLDHNGIELKNGMIRTNKNQLTSAARYGMKKFEDNFAQLHTKPIFVDEFQFLIPTLHIPIHPKISLDTKIDKETAILRLLIADGEQRISIRVISDNLAHILKKKKNTSLNYQANIDLEQIKLSKWTGKDALQYDFSGNLKLRGEGINPKTMESKLVGHLDNISLLGRKLKKIDLDIDYSYGSANVLIKGKSEWGRMKLQSHIDALLEKTPQYDATLIIEQLDLSKILLDSTLKSRINMKSTISGRGIAPKNMTANLTTTIDSLSLKNFRLAHTAIHANYNRGNITAQLLGKNNNGQIHLDANVQRLTSNNPTYGATLTTQKLDLSTLLSNNMLTSDLNLNLIIDGEGLSTKKLNLKTQISAQPSTLLGFHIDNIDTKLTYKEQNLKLEKLFLNTPTISIDVKGNYALNKQTNIQGQIQVKNAKELSKIMKQKDFKTNGRLQFAINGDAQQQTAYLNFDMGKTSLNSTLVADSLTGKLNAQLTPNDTTINAQLSTQKLMLSNILFDKGMIDINSNIRESDIRLSFLGKQLHTEISGQLMWRQQIDLLLDKIKINYQHTHWKLSDTLPARIKIDKNKYEVQHFELYADTTQQTQKQHISIDGWISKNGKQKMDIQMDNIDIAGILHLLQNKTPLSGTLQLNAMLRGTARHPLINAHTHIDKLIYQQYELQKFSTDIQYIDHRMQLNTYVLPYPSGSLRLSGYLPYEIRLDHMTFAPHSRDTIDLDLTMQKFPLNIAKAFYPIDAIDGYLQSHINIGGTWDNPNPNGAIYLKNGKAKIKKYGIDYPNLLATIKLQKDKITVDTILVKSKKGKLLAKGQLDFTSSFYNADLQKSDINIHLDHFQPLNHRYYNTEISGNAELKGEKDSVYFSGDLNILQALLYLPAITNQFGNTSPAEIPQSILVSELIAKGMAPASLTPLPTSTNNSNSVDTTTRSNYFDHLYGKINIYIPRNTWIKNEQMRIELAGDVELIKHPTFVELFGTVDVIRGQYEMLGKIFKIKEGTLTFQGGEKINPKLDIVGTYEFRDNQKRRKMLTINIDGEMNKPTITFILDKTPINEGDAISYILFGMSLDALGMGKQEQLSKISTADLATNLAANILSAELTKILGKTFNVDYIEMRTGDNFDNATFVVGKYITNKLFMSYERRFGNLEEQNIAPYEVKLEYELWRFLFLQLVGSPMTNGVDLIFKIDSKTSFKE